MKQDSVIIGETRVFARSGLDWRAGLVIGLKGTSRIRIRFDDKGRDRAIHQDCVREHDDFIEQEARHARYMAEEEARYAREDAEQLEVENARVAAAVINDARFAEISKKLTADEMSFLQTRFSAWSSGPFA